jgi:hypothetical protein
MTPNETISYGPKQLTEMILRDRGITEGNWILALEFGLVAANTGPSPDEVYPTAIIPVQKIGIARVSEPNPMSVDASKTLAQKGKAPPMTKAKATTKTKKTEAVEKKKPSRARGTA